MDHKPLKTLIDRTPIVGDIVTGTREGISKGLKLGIAAAFAVAALAVGAFILSVVK